MIPATKVPAALACVRSLGSRGIRTIVVASESGHPAISSRYCDEAITVPGTTEDLLAYRDELVEVARRDDVATIIPTHEEDVYLFARDRAAFENDVSLVTPTLETLEKAHDRLLLTQVAQRAGVPVPETRLLSELAEWPDEAVVKSRYNLLADAYLDGITADEATTVDTIAHSNPAERPDVETLQQDMGHDPIVQEYVPSDGKYMVGALCDHGDTLALFQHEQIRGTTYVGAGGVYRESVSIPALGQAARDLLAQLDWHGLACIEYMKDADTGEFKLLEINPRMWQSLASTVRMGADFPAYYWLQATGQSEKIDPEYDVGVGCHWLFGEMRHLVSLYRDDSPISERPGYARTMWDITTSCLRHPNFDYLKFDDPAPFLQQWLTPLADLAGRECYQIGQDKLHEKAPR